MLASIILAREDKVKCLHFSNDYYGMIFRATQSVELFCAYQIRECISFNTLLTINNVALSIPIIINKYEI